MWDTLVLFQRHACSETLLGGEGRKEKNNNHNNNGSEAVVVVVVYYQCYEVKV